MMTWILVAAAGGVLSLSGLAVLLRRSRRGEITRTYLWAMVVGYTSFVSFALISAFRPDLASGPVTIAILVPASVAIVVLIREHRRNADPHQSGR